MAASTPLVINTLTLHPAIANKYQEQLHTKLINNKDCQVDQINRIKKQVRHAFFIKGINVKRHNTVLCILVHLTLPVPLLSKLHLTLEHTET